MRPRRRSPSLLRFALAGALAGGVALARPATAAAEPSAAELQRARDWFAQARRLEDAGRWPEALDLLQRVAAVKTTPQVRFHVALCMKHVGLWSAALEGFQRAAREAEGKAPDVIAEAREHIAELERRTPAVVPAIAGAEPGDVVLLDGRPLTMSDPPASVRVDPGPHTFEVRRGDHVVGRKLFVAQPGARTRIDVVVDPSLAPPPKPATPAPQAPAGVPASGEAASSSGHLQRALGWTAVGVAGAALVATGVAAGLRAGALADLDAHCPTHRDCDPSVEPIVERGRTHATLVNLFAVVAGASAAAGAVLLLTAPSSTEKPRPAGVALGVAPLARGAAGSVAGWF